MSKEEMYIWQCEECGRICRCEFYEHASNKKMDNYCEGKVRRIKFKNAW